MTTDSKYRNSESYLPEPCFGLSVRAVHPGCGLQPVVRGPACGANDGRGGRADADAAAATIVMLLRTAVAAAPWTYRSRCMLTRRLSSTTGCSGCRGGGVVGCDGGAIGCFKVRHQKRQRRCY